MLEHAGRPQKVVDGRVEALLRGAILLGPDLGVDGGQVEQDAGFFECDRSLTGWDACVGRRTREIRVMKLVDDTLLTKYGMLSM